MPNEDVLIRIVADGATVNREMRKVENTVDRARRKVGGDLRSMDNTFKRRFASMGRAVGRTLRSLGRIGARGALAGAAAAGGLAILIKRSIEAADTIAKTAKAASVSAETLQEYRFAARRAGVETTALDKALLFLIKSVAELKTRVSSELTTALQDFNPELLKTLKNTNSQTEAFRLIAEAIRTADTDLERAAIARAAFGRGGLLMVNMLRDGTVGLDEMAAKARELGLVMSNEVAAKAEAANDALGDLADVLTQRVIIAIAEQSDTIRDMAIQMTEAIPEIIGMTAAFLRWANIIETPDTIRLTEIRDRIQEIDETLENSLFRRLLEGGVLSSGPGPLGEERGDLVGEAEALQERIGLAQERARRRQVARDQERQAQMEAAAAATAEAAAKRQVVADEKSLQSRTTAAQRFLDRVNSAFLAASDEQIKLIEKRRDADLAALEEILASEEEKAQARVEINKRAEIDIAEIRKKAVDDAKRDAEKTARDAKRSQKTLESSAEKSGEVIKDMGRDAAESFQGVVRGTETVADAFERMSQRILDALFDIALNDLTGGTNKLGDLFGSIFKGFSLGGSSGGGGGFVPTPGGGFDIFHKGGIVGEGGSAKRPLLIASNTNIPRLHQGGVLGLRSNETAAILENDEEVLTARSPRHRRNMGGGMTVIQNFPEARNEVGIRTAGSESAAKTAAAGQRGMMRKGIG